MLICSMMATFHIQLSNKILRQIDRYNTRYMFYPWMIMTKQVDICMTKNNDREKYRQIDKWIEDKNRELCLNTDR